MEPGHMTLGAISLIFANRCNITNKYVAMLIIVELCCFSLAGYVTLFLGYVLLHFNKSGFGKILIGAFAVFFLLMVVSNLGFKSRFDELILDRLQFIDGNIAGNERTTEEFDNRIFRDLFSNLKYLLFGTAQSTSELMEKGGGAGYKVYWVQHGLIGVLLVIQTYISYLLYRKKHAIKVLSLILLLLLFQNSYPTWYCILIPFVLGVDYLTNYKSNERTI